MFDLKSIQLVLQQLKDERGIPPEKVLEAIEAALAMAFKKEQGKRNQIVRASFDLETGKTDFYQVKIVVDPKDVKVAGKGKEETEMENEEDINPQEKIYFNSEQHIFLEDAQRIKRDVQVNDELIFPLDTKEEYSRIAAQAAKQVIMQKIREAERVSISSDFGQKEGEIVTGTVQRFERGNLYIDLGRALGMIAYEDQIPGERFRQGERVRALLYKVEETPRGIFLKLSRSSSDFLKKLFAEESPEIASGVVEIKFVAREAGSRSKIAVVSHEEEVDPIGACVGQRGVRVTTIMSELRGEKIDIIEWSEEQDIFIEESLSPARVLSVEINESEHSAKVEVAPDQQSLAIGRGGQNVRLAAKLTGWKIDIHSVGGFEQKTNVDEESVTSDLSQDTQKPIVQSEQESVVPEKISDENLNEDVSETAEESKN